MTNPNTSASGGFLAPIASPPGPAAPLEGEALLVFLQSVVVGITGLPGNMVRPRWQPEAPNIPQTVTAWAAIGVNLKPSDTFAATIHQPDANGGQGQDLLVRTEELELDCSFYDTGSTGLADMYVALLRDGLSIAQNRETLQLNNMGLISVSTPTPVPVVLKRRWLYRVDCSVGIRQLVTRAYPVLNLTQAAIDVVAETPSGSDIEFSILTPVP